MLDASSALNNNMISTYRTCETSLTINVCYSFDETLIALTSKRTLFQKIP